MGFHIVVRTIAAIVLVLSALTGPALAAGQKADDRKTAEQHYRDGLAAYRAGDLKGARKEFERARSKKKDYSDAYLMLATIARQRGETRKAVGEVKRALEHQPDSAVGHLLYGRLHFDQNDAEKARAEAEVALKLNPNLYAAYVLLGDLEAAERDFDAAVAAYDEATRLLPPGQSEIPWKERMEAVKDMAAFRVKKFKDDPAYVAPRLVGPLPMPIYTAAARENRVSGAVELGVRIDEKGQVDRIIIFTGLPDGLIDAAIVAARKLRAEPATLNGTPVPAWLTVKVNFSVR